MVSLEAMRPGSQAHDEMVVGDDGRIARLSNVRVVSRVACRMGSRSSYVRR